MVFAPLGNVPSERQRRSVRQLPQMQSSTSGTRNMAFAQEADGWRPPTEAQPPSPPHSWEALRYVFTAVFESTEGRRSCRDA